MDRRSYTLVTRAATILILALLAAPLWDSWRYRGLPASVGAGFPVGVIVSAPRSVPAAPPDLDAVMASGLAGGEAAGAVPASDKKQSGTAPDMAPSPQAAQSAPAPAHGRRFEAWTARAQVDPFWDGGTAPRPDRKPAADPPAAADGFMNANARATRPAPRAGATRGPVAPREPAQDDGRIADAGARPPDGAAQPAPQGAEGMGLLGWPVQPGADINHMPPPMKAEPIPSGAAVPPRASPPPPAPGDPKPTAVPIPSVSIAVSAPQVAVGDQVVVAIRIESADRVTSLPFHLIFDPAVLEFLDSATGPALAGRAPVLLASVSPNRPGDVAVGLSLIESSGTFSGSGEVVQLRFRALETGRSDLSFDRATLRGPQSAPVEVRFADGAVIVN